MLTPNRTARLLLRRLLVCGPGMTAGVVLSLACLGVLLGHAIEEDRERETGERRRP